MSDLIDVAIVGYGPVGQALALHLLQQGHRVAVLERWPTPYALPRAVSIDHEAMRILQSIGVAEAFQPETCLSERYEWRNAEGKVLLSFDGMDRPALCGWPTVNGFSQPALEHLLDERVRKHPNATVLQGWEVVALDDHGEHVRVRAHATGQPADATREITARYVVGCDGAGSFVRQAMGSEYHDLGFSADWLVVDVMPKDPSRWNGDLVQVCDPARPTTMVASGPGRRRLEFMLLPGEHKDAMNTVDAAWRLLAPWDWTPDNAVLERHAVYTFRGCVATQWRRGRLLLAGDAAHLTPPFAGQGLCAGLRDAAALAWRLDAVLSHRASESLLDSYGPERSGHARAFIEFAIQLGGVICVLDPAAAAGRDQAMLSGNAPAPQFPAGRLSASALLRAGDPHAGGLALQARVQSGERVGRFDDIVGHGFTLIGLGHDPAAQLDAQQRDFLAQLGVRVAAIGEQADEHAPLRDIDGDYTRWFTELGCRAVLVRPDFYLFGAGDAGALVQALQNAAAWQRPALQAQAA